MRFVTMVIILWLFLFGKVSSNSCNCSSKAVNLTISDTLDELFKRPRYDSRIRPNIHGSPVKIKMGFWVLSIDSVSVKDMAFGLDIFLRQDWIDRRLDHGLNKTLSLSHTVMSNVWLPDTYFKNAKQSNFHEVTAKNIMIRIGPLGFVHYNTRITLKAACIMDLRLYPFDVQKCSVLMESYGYSIDHIIYEWEAKDTDGMKFVPGDAKVLPQFRLIDVQLETLFTQYVIGNWSGVKATFTFERTYSFYLIHIYGPSALIVVISWISFFLPYEQAPARITLGVTSLLTEVTILTMSNQAIPRVNYVKSIDKYLITCFLFVFATLVEYAIILTIANRQKHHRKAKHTANKKEDFPLIPTHVESSDPFFHHISSENGSATYHRKIDRSSLAIDDSKQPKKKKNSIRHKMASSLYRTENIILLDEYSQKLFLVFFALFNCYYWICVFYYPNFI
ncbi:glycine receptor subunit alphaZ1 [Exaiptasia diaphana]|uniref:Gamma-aminobutyric acid receptor subunit beta n=1 Tax=Exaiptasia diaphana TaxID=2652724 RepID=A0A913Y5K3_EXADI|nr:glycine receptor subunit alphaZ1 [Exaiptasia diaphana]